MREKPWALVLVTSLFLVVAACAPPGPRIKGVQVDQNPVLVGTPTQVCADIQYMEGTTGTWSIVLWSYGPYTLEAQAQGTEKDSSKCVTFTPKKPGEHRATITAQYDPFPNSTEKPGYSERDEPIFVAEPSRLGADQASAAHAERASADGGGPVIAGVTVAAVG